MKVKQTAFIFKKAQKFLDVLKKLILNGNNSNSRYYLNQTVKLFIKRTSFIIRVIIDEYLFAIFIFRALNKCQHKTTMDH